jgi:hypothetical protein
MRIWVRLKLGRTLGVNFTSRNWLDDVLYYVRRCSLCHRAKSIQDTQLGLHTETAASYPLERGLFDFKRPLVLTERGNQAMLVVMHISFKFVGFYPVRNHTSAIVCDI